MGAAHLPSRISAFLNRRPPVRRSRALLAFVAAMVPLGVVAHLFAELCGLGADDAELIFSARHLYLWGLALAAFAVLAALVLRVPAHRRRVAVDELVDALPGAGRGFAFASLAFGAQLGFVLVTELGEGAPLSSGHLLVALVGALLASFVGAVVATVGRRRLLDLVIALIVALDPRAEEARRVGVRREVAVRRDGVRRYARRFCRPPPSLHPRFSS